MRYGYFKYLIILFGLINMLTSFQTYINKIITGLINIIYIIYLNNILIFSKNRTFYV